MCEVRYCYVSFSSQMKVYSFVCSLALVSPMLRKRSRHWITHIRTRIVCFYCFMTHCSAGFPGVLPGR
jgi:hypothetical protein